jgi:nicotinamide riboside transporter PnuC
LSGRWTTNTASLNVHNVNRSQRLEIVAKVIAVIHHSIQARGQMHLINSPDFWIQSIASLFAIVNIYLLAQGHIKIGCQIGLVGQLIFIYIFIDAQQYPLLATDTILFVIYIKKLYEIRKYKYRRIQL